MVHTAFEYWQSIRDDQDAGPDKTTWNQMPFREVLTQLWNWDDLGELPLFMSGHRARILAMRVINKLKVILYRAQARAHIERGYLRAHRTLGNRRATRSYRPY